MDTKNPSNLFEIPEGADMLTRVNAIRDSLIKEFDAVTMGTQANVATRYSFYRTTYLLSMIKTPNDMLVTSKQDQEMLKLMMELYADIIIDLDERIEQAIAQMGDMVPKVLCRMFSSGYSETTRFMLYFDGNSVKSNPYIWWLSWKVLLRQIIAAALIMFLSQRLITTIPNFFSHKFRIFGLIILISITAYMYATAYNFEFLYNQLFGPKYSDEEEAQIAENLTNFIDLTTHVYNSREEIKFYINDLVSRAKSMILETPYGTIITMDEIRAALIYRISDKQRYRLFVLLGIGGAKDFLSSPELMYWSVSDQIRSKGWIFVIVLGSLYWILTGLVAGLSFSSPMSFIQDQIGVFQTFLTSTAGTLNGLLPDQLIQR